MNDIANCLDPGDIEGWLRDEIDELSAKLAERESEITRMRRELDVLDRRATAYFLALKAVIEAYHPGRSLTDLEHMDPPWPLVVKAFRE